MSRLRHTSYRLFSLNQHLRQKKDQHSYSGRLWYSRQRPLSRTRTVYTKGNYRPLSGHRHSARLFRYNFMPHAKVSSVFFLPLRQVL